MKNTVQPGHYEHTTYMYFNQANQAAAWHSDRQRWAEAYPVTAALAEGLFIEPTISAHVPTATTDGKRVLFNTSWSETLNATSREFIHAHLVWHAVAGDYRPVHCRELHRWHLACDHNVNMQLLQLGHDLSNDAVFFPAAAAWPVEKVYTWLAKHPRLDIEAPLDRMCWEMAPSPVSLQLEALEAGWHRHVQAVIERYRGTPALPDPVAAWLLKRK
ncbi:hypothetical protein R5M92_04170 [Halomonas sp. Bachu 37]|uniref:DUF2201 family putative metallopeptidase n=1 Tax=Halomonas kashgarensis TaxID=3084920 RepID=UPI003216CB64